MPNGEERYLLNTASTVSYFNAKYGHWPTRLRLNPSLIALLQSALLKPRGFTNLSAKVQIIPDPSVGIVAEDDDGHTLDIRDPKDDLRLNDPIGTGLDWLCIGQEDIVIKH